jgi:hypothetical protein
VQNGDDDTMISFLGEGHSHDEEEAAGEEEHGERFEIEGVDDLLWSARWVNGFELSQDLEVQFGLSTAYGPNLFHDQTTLVGADLVAKWYNPNAPAGAGTLAWTTEAIWRDIDTEEGEGESASTWGLVSSLVYDPWPRWRVGLRVDYLDLDEEAGHEEAEGEAEEAEHAGTILRLAPLLAWLPSEFSKLRLQYNFTTPEHGEDVHSVWLGLEVLIGAHPAHGF